MRVTRVPLPMHRYQFLALAALLFSGQWNWSGTPQTNPRGWDLVNSGEQVLNHLTLNHRVINDVLCLADDFHDTRMDLTSAESCTVGTVTTRIVAPDVTKTTGMCLSAITSLWSEPKAASKRATAVHAHSYGTWDEFFNVTTAIFEGAMECQDCYRETEVWNVTRIYERRIYNHDGIHLEYMELFAWCSYSLRTVPS